MTRGGGRESPRWQGGGAELRCGAARAEVASCGGARRRRRRRRKRPGQPCWQPAVSCGVPAGVTAPGPVFRVSPPAPCGAGGRSGAALASG